MTKSITLSQEQQSILKINWGKHIVLAPPGSGKTELLVQRLNRELSAGSNPEKMVCLTFTNRAATSMRTRVGEVHPDIHVGNFHSLAIRILKKIGIFKAFYTVLDEEDTELFLNIALDELFAVPAAEDESGTSDPILNMLEEEIDLELAAKFNMFRMGGVAEMRPPYWDGRKTLKTQLRKLILPFVRFQASIEYDFPVNVRDSEFKILKDSMGYTIGDNGQKRPLIWAQVIMLSSLKRLAKIFKEIKLQYRAFDFDDLLIETLRWLVDNPNQIQFDWVQVDECQDLNEIQWEILKNVTAPGTCLLIFADPQQSIYSFMGSNPENLKRHCLGFKVSKLLQNFSSPSYLIDIYRKFAQQHFGFQSEWFYSTEKDKKGDELIYVTCSTDLDEQYYLAKKIIPGLLKNTQGNIAILNRSNKGAVEVSEALHYNGVDHFIVAQFDLFRLTITKDFMAFLQSIATPESKLPWIRLLSSANSNLSLKDSLRIIDACYDAGLLPHWFLNGHLSDRCCPPMEIIHLAKYSRIVVFDTETTGTDPFKDDIIQIAAIEIVKGIIGNHIDFYLNTEKDIGSSQKVHGITKKFLEENGIDRHQAFGKFLEFIGNDPICAHNIRFDLSMIETNLLRINREGIWNKNPTYCTLEITRALDPDSPNHKLATLIERYGIEGQNTHNALDDVRATANLILSLEKQAITKMTKVKNFYDKNMSVLKNLDNLFGGIWKILRKPNPEKKSFNDLFRIYINLASRKSHPARHIDEIKGKLLKHMDMTSTPAPIQKLLENDLHRYLLYREPDLILESDRVVVSTIHRAKGLEFDTVIIPSCHSNSYPNYYATLDKSGQLLEEEKRIFYVALTRAKIRIVIIQPRVYTTAKGKGMEVRRSPFMDSIISEFKFIEIPQHYAIDKNALRSRHVKHECPECGRTWPWDGSSQGNDRCFGCGYVP